MDSFRDCHRLYFMVTLAKVKKKIVVFPEVMSDRSVKGENKVKGI